MLINSIEEDKARLCNFSLNVLIAYSFFIIEEKKTSSMKNERERKA
jgi:hypothetical protein